MPTIHCVRHAEGVHNLNPPHNHSILDPLLTSQGEAQCRTLQTQFPAKHDIGLIVCSPLRRTIYTSLLGFDNIVKHGVRVVALAELQEISDLPCDTGSPLETLDKEFEGLSVDLSNVHEGWDSKRGPWAPVPEAIHARAAAARSWLKAQPESEIVVVSHGAFLHYLTEDWSGSDRFLGTGWANTEFRSYAFDPSTQNSLVELPESRERRQEKMLSPAEQMHLWRTAQDTWTNQGFMVQKVEA